MDQSWQYSWTVEAHSVFKWLLIVQFILSIGIGIYTGNILLPLILSVPIVFIPIYLGYSMPHEVVSRHAVGIATQLMAALHIQQTLGMTEMHFQIFVMLAFLFFFKDWKVVISSVLVVAVHHIGFFILQANNVSGIYAFEEGRVAFLILVIHAVFAVAEGALLAVMAHRSQKEAVSAELINSTVKGIMRDDGKLDLNVNNLKNEVVLADFNSMLSTIQGLIQQVHRAGNELLSVVQKVTHSSQMLDQSVDVQNQQVSQISQSMQQITQSISTVANLSKDANDVADHARQNTNGTRDKLNESSENIGKLKTRLQTTSSTISDLSGKCSNISEVMQSIKAVAEQTNLLALNAAIESARAGEHGRGFAVVADEVRNLAIKSKESAEEIELITLQLTDSANTSVKNMNDCVEMVESAVESSNVASENMAGVMQNIETVNQNVTTVADSSNEQASNSETVNESTQGLYEMFAEEKNQVDSLKHEINELNELASALQMQLNKFAI